MQGAWGGTTWACRGDALCDTGQQHRCGEDLRDDVGMECADSAPPGRMWGGLQGVRGGGDWHKDNREDVPWWVQSGKQELGPHQVLQLTLQ